MNILLTRPLIDCEDLMSELFSKGHKIIHLPTLKILSANMEAIDTNDYDIFIFTSTNAVRNLEIKNTKILSSCFCVGSITEKFARAKGFINSYSAGGTVNALKNLILNSSKVQKDSKIAYICGDNISYDLDKELLAEGYKIKKIINYYSEKIEDLNNENNKLIKDYPPRLIFVYSKRSAESLNEIVKKYNLASLMTQSIVKCISINISYEFKKAGWKKVEIFNSGEEIFEIEKYQ